MIPLNIARLSIAVLVQLLIQILTAAKNNAHSEVIMANGAIKALEPMIAKLKEARFKAAYSGMGQEVKNANKRRTTLYSSLKKFLQGMFAFGGEQADAAKILVKEMEVKPNLTKLGYAEKSFALDEVCTRFSTTQNKALIELAGVASKVDALKAAHEDFEMLVMTQADTNSTLGQADSATELRPDAETVLRNALSIIWGMRSDPEWVDFYHDVLKIVQLAKNTLRDLSGKSEKGAKN